MPEGPGLLATLLPQLRQRAKEEQKINKKFFQKLGQRKPKALDDTVAGLHEAVFADIDCLQCANCCKTTSPIFRDIDIDRIAAHLRQRPADFITQYLHLDEEGDYVLNSAPCPFLGAGHYCSIYEVRPKACREYPHTDRKNFHQILGLTLKNTAICPAAFEVVKRLREKF
ncbi:MAG: YkgJ family cysteine cluster protein [Phaeodactylibacter sp.]|nr:YkgJ family cysteine cluster protein [Phaeodactylibacter sp.]MCB9299673.1 YkgJ family cysteine cluster protein [Lewinellaceae bacterium]HQU61355.1 YkgJ family cysteine cluster protein [Saprospiraceae bacterium]